MQLEPTTHALYWQAFKVGIVGGMELVERPNVYTTAIAMFAAIRAECGDGEMSERASERASFWPTLLFKFSFGFTPFAFPQGKT